ncbi:alkaline phosphatase PhoX [Actinopolymorpha sp. NPDC004070]|uniref:PhoX family protein n=1 Tax=Actinopolymorpha sp. NPDC004070 TaxID=3154548 RepID=UPI0033AFF0CC
MNPLSSLLPRQFSRAPQPDSAGDGTFVLPLEWSRGRSCHRGAGQGLMVAGREAVDASTGTPTNLCELSVVAVRRTGSGEPWQEVASGGRAYDRRFTETAPFVLTGPAAGHRLLRTVADPSGRRVLGTSARACLAVTPWGTTLHGERTLRPSADQSVRRDPHEANRFGWLVELDPYDPDATPRKRTMPGRFERERMAISLTSDGRVAIDMVGVGGAAGTGAAEPGAARYRFVSRDRVRPGTTAAEHRHNMGLLDHGTLYAAGGPGRTEGWVRLCDDEQSYVPGRSVTEVLLAPRSSDRADDALPLL